MNLTSEQETALKEFKAKVGTLSPSYMNSDYDLVRWLKARYFNVAQAEAMLIKHMKWRKEWEIDTIFQWEIPEVLKKYCPAGHSGFDKDGDPVWIIRHGLCDVRGLMSSCSKREIMRYGFFLFESSLDIMRKKSEGLEVPIRQASLIADLECFTLRQFVWKPALDVFFSIVPMLEMNYPEVLKYVYIVNAPMIYTIAFSMIKPFLHELTIKKIKVHGSSGWKEVLLNDIDEDQIPAHYGGTMIDPDGDTTCPSKICPGGEVPKSYYLKNRKNEESANNQREKLKYLIIPQSGKKEITLRVDIPGTELRWIFETDNYDVGFGISRIVSQSEEWEELIPLQRYNSQIGPEEGSLLCIDPGIYKITFDNEFSYLRSKIVYYSIDLHLPSEHIKM